MQNRPAVQITTAKLVKNTNGGVSFGGDVVERRFWFEVGAQGD